MKITMPEILELMSENNPPEQTAAFLQDRVHKDAKQLAEDIVRVFKSAGAKESQEYWMKVLAHLNET